MKKYYLFILFFTFLFTYFFYNSLFLEKEKVIGNSMIPTLKNEELVCLYKNYYSSSKKVKRLDIIALNLKTKGDFVKRIIAIPGDKVIFGKDFYIYINGKKQTENYITSSKKYNNINIKLLLTQLENYNNIIPNNMFLVLGDNRLNSFDSTSFGLIHFDQIIGKVYKPFNSFCY